MQFFIPIFVAFQFLTIIPPVIKRVFTPQELGRAAGLFPLVGLFIGGLMAGLDALTGLVFPDAIRAGLLLAFWVLVTGALHLDGFLDSLDGLLGGFTPVKRLEIMHDERVGAFGFSGGLLLLLLKFGCLEALTSQPGASVGLLLSPTLGRWAMSVGIFAFPYARKKGLGREFKDHTTWRQATLATAITLGVCWFTVGWMGLIASAVVLILVFSFGWFVLQRIPGMTGDVYGAACEIAELAVLLVIVAWGSN